MHSLLCRGRFRGSKGSSPPTILACTASKISDSRLPRVCPHINFVPQRALDSISEHIFLRSIPLDLLEGSCFVFQSMF